MTTTPGLGISFALFSGIYVVLAITLIVLRDDHLHDLRCSPEVEDLLDKLEAYELPLNTRYLVFRYYE